MEKSAAEKLVLEQWRALPVSQRKTLDQALAFADTAAATIVFDTVGNPKAIIRAWVVREFQGGAEITKAIRELRTGGK